MIINKMQCSESVVYFLKSENGLVKIGTTKKLENRKRALRSQCGFKEEDFFCVDGSYKTESFFKIKYKKFNTFGEWFKIDFKILKNEIENLTLNINEKEEECIENKVDFVNKNTFRILDLHERYFSDLINCLVIKEQYKNETLETLIRKGFEFNKELGKEEEEDFLSDMDYIEDKYDMYCYIERYGEFSDYKIDFILKRYFEGKINYRECLELGLFELKKIKTDTAITFQNDLESKIATYIEAWKMLDLTDKEIYEKIKEKI